MGIFALLMLTAALLAGCTTTTSSDTPEASWTPPAAPSLETGILDDTDTLTADELAAVSKAIANNSQDDTQPQIAVYVTNRVPKNHTIEQAALETARTWGVGGAGEKNGVLLFIAKDDRELRIEVAGGVEDRLTDAKSNQIIEGIITPEFKKGDFGAGIKEGVTAIRATVSGEEVAPTTEAPSDGGSAADENSGVSFSMFIILGFVAGISLLGVIAMVFRSIRGGGSGYSSYSGSSGRSRGTSRRGALSKDDWDVPTAVYVAGTTYADRNRDGGSSSSGSSSSSSFPTSFGGGGGFNGGGASGSW